MHSLQGAKPNSFDTFDLGVALAGTAIVLAHEPENEYDSHAIAVRLLDGKRLGYVPRDITQSPFFAQPVSFGHVRSLGVGASSGLFGVQVRTNVEFFQAAVGA